MVKKIISSLREKGLPDLSGESVWKLTKDHLSHLSKVESFLFVQPWVKVPLFVGGIFVLNFLLVLLFPASLFVSSISILLMLFFNLYLVSFIVFLIRHSFKSLLSARNLWGLFLSYVFFMIGVLLFFSSAYASVERMGSGYLTYGSCGSVFDESMISSDPGLSHDYFYFSAITLFTVGYGEICPMGFDKGLAIFNAFIGNFIYVVLMVFVISAYIKRSNN